MSGLSVEQLTQKAREFLPSRHYLYAVIAIAGMQFLATMDGTIAVVTLPKIQAELHLNDATRSWVITAYMLSFGGLMLLGGRLGDTFGRKRVSGWASRKRTSVWRFSASSRVWVRPSPRPRRWP
ncbi:Putative transmembrane efflux protein [Mycobacteroides abscessus subsp. abscessus]|nr:Putative transmembrane efflux protein [Mycobacteroides abscessus subsp. abscessus]